MSLVEKRYAEAIVDLYCEKKLEELDSLQENLGFIATQLREEKNFFKLLKSPKLTMEEKKSLINDSFRNRIDDYVVKLVLLLLDKGRIDSIPAIYEESVRLIDIKKLTINMTITSSHKLENEQVEKIKEKYLEIYKAKEAKVMLLIDENLIGGIKIQIEDKITNASTKVKLEDLRKKLLSL